MNSLQTIATRAAASNLPFVVAGGHAVIAHGHQRTTFDLDLIIRRSDRGQWIELAQNAGYVLFHERPTFVQFNSAGSQLLPLDTMFVNEETFAKLLAEAIIAAPARSTAWIVSLRHLLALKCHAIKHGHPGRIVKDAHDVIQLVQVNRVDLNMAQVNSYEKVRRVCSRDERGGT